DNPFQNAVYSYGHRNPQGLAWDKDGNLWATEHGRSGSLSGFDELNLIEKGKNYGWPLIQGDETREGMVSPVIHSGADKTWAPAGAAFLNGKIYFGGLRGEALFEYDLVQKSMKEYFKGQFGRIRAVAVKNGFLYITTSNTDGRGNLRAGDDKMIKINPESLK
ncbi:PQQ-dependent sugar dehydrogenase, partial [Candidatus Daviesbacteria bacterium]|nr:PQQ-dependent sugar dehydrogenase [Candidatus Daviesbacteria bacterium]